MRRRVFLNWGLSSFFGWGVYGLNLALAWASDPEIEPLPLVPVDPAELAIDPLRMAALDSVITRSHAAFQERLAQGASWAFDAPLLVPLGNDLGASASRARQALHGAPTVGIVFFENTQFSEEAIACGRSLPVIVTGSTWNERILREYGLTNVRTVLQGVDPTLFHPAPAANLMGDRFKVFSGGKLELRKGQDIVVEAFRRFARSHPDAVLVSAWHSPWAHLAKTLDLSGRAAPVVFKDDGDLDPAAWRPPTTSRAISSWISAAWPTPSCRRFSARWTSPCSRIAAREAPISSPWNVWPAASRPSCRPIPAIST